MREIVWGGDNEYFSDSREHEHGQRIIDHRFIVYRHQLLGSGQSQWIKPSAAATGKDYTFHKGGIQIVRISYLGQSSLSDVPCKLRANPAMVVTRLREVVQ